jgi:hypothetical protein
MARIAQDGAERHKNALSLGKSVRGNLAESRAGQLRHDRYHPKELWIDLEREQPGLARMALAPEERSQNARPAPDKMEVACERRSG